MLTIYRRHRKACAHRDEGREYRRCKCPIWTDGFLAGREIRKSLGTRDWEKAQEIVRQWEAEGECRTTEDGLPVSVEHATEAFEADAVARSLRDRTVYKYKVLFRQLKAFAEVKGIRFLKELDTATLRQFRASWKDKNLAALKKLERLRSFFRFVVSNGWLAANPTTGLKNPKVNMRPTLPFSQEEMVKILAGIQAYAEDRRVYEAVNPIRLRALVLLLRYSGLRISDAVACLCSRLIDGKLRLYTQKTGTHVYVPLPEFVVKELSVIPPMSDTRWFWSGNGKLETAVADWQGRLQKLSEYANVANVHAHRFRDTFAVELLLSGVPLERVSILLGHTSVRVTEKHYSPWIRERQEQAEADVRRTWAKDTLVLLETKGTPEVQQNSEAVN
jgi:site-specific recombinase XerD